MTTRVKLCGFRTQQTFEYALELGVDYIGINFYFRSKRYIGDTIPGWLKGREASTPLIGVFVDPALDELERAIEQTQLAGVQLHSKKKCMPELLKSAFEIKKKNCNLIVWSALDGVRYTPSVGVTWPCLPDAILLDTEAQAKDGGGGTGRTWDASEVRHHVVDASLDLACCGQDSRVPFWLAGGLNAQNVARKIAALNPTGVDVASGIENASGDKDCVKMRDFVRSIRK